MTSWMLKHVIELTAIADMLRKQEYIRYYIIVVNIHFWQSQLEHDEGAVHALYQRIIYGCGWPIIRM